MHRLLARLASVVLILLVLSEHAPPARADGDEPFACPIKAVMAREDAGFTRIYDGVRKGLEQAQLPRVCLVNLASPGGPEALAALGKHAPPLLFVIGAEAARRLPESLLSVPRVYVDCAWQSGDERMPPDPEVPAPATLVRGVVSVERLQEVLQSLFPLPRTGLPLGVGDDAASRDAVKRIAERTGFHVGEPGQPADFGLLLGAWRGSARPDLEALVEDARKSRRPLLADDLDLWGRGAAVLLLPDHYLLGRVAADAGRLLLRGGPARVTTRTVGLAEVRVDLEESARQGLHLPVPFLAGADALRGMPQKPPAQRPGR